MSEYFDVTTDYLLKGIETARDDSHKTFGDVLDQKVLTETNGKRAKKILRYLLYVFLGIVVVDLLSFIIYVIVHGIPM